MALGGLTQPRPNLVRAWFDTVLNPILGELRYELKLLRAGNLTWRFSHQRMVSLYPLAEHLAPAALDNYEQFVSLFPQCREPIAKHDALVEELNERCLNLQNVLAECQAMREAFAKATAGWSEQDLGACFSAVRPEDRLKGLAEYIIDSTGHLPDYYTTASLWNQHRADFVKIRESPEVRQNWESTLNTAGELRRSVEGLITTLTSLRNELSLSLDVPIVDRVLPERYE
jgi:hypothetical protein